MSQSSPEFPPNGARPREIPLDGRRSVPARLLREPGPDDATLLRMLASAVRVPDHGKRVPFRFVRISGDARASLGEVLARHRKDREPGVSDAVLDKDRGRFTHAPLVVAVVAIIGPDDKIPEAERYASACCVCFALLQAAQSLGFGAQWLTGWAAHDGRIREALGLSGEERIAGFIHIGTPVQEAPERERPDPASLLSDWQPPN